MASTVGPVCRFVSLFGTICSSVVVLRDCVGMYLATLSLIKAT